MTHSVQLAMAVMKHLLLSILILFSIITISTSLVDDCVYTIYVQTGDDPSAATDSNITLTVWDKKGDGVLIEDLVSWGGLMGKGHNYFEIGNLDIFSGRGPCLTTPMCELELSNGWTGRYPSWYCEFVQVHSASLHSGCSSKHFEVSQWLSKDKPPQKTTANVNDCGLIQQRRIKSTTSVL